MNGYNNRNLKMVNTASHTKMYYSSTDNHKPHNMCILYIYIPVIFEVQIYSVTATMSWSSDEQTTARGPDAARLEVLSGPRQTLK